MNSGTGYTRLGWYETRYLGVHPGNSHDSQHLHSAD